MNKTVIEKAYRFGQTTMLSGILSEADNKAIKNKHIAIILLNAGLINKSGPFQLNTLLAREVAQMGIPAFRFDISGIGDSHKHQDTRPRDKQIMADIQDAMDVIKTAKGINKFIILGLCTGADNAHKITLMDERIVGAIFMDGYAYPSIKYHIKVWRNKLKKPQTIIRSLWRSGKKTTATDTREIGYFWTLPDKKKTEKELKQFIARDVQMLYIFTGSWRTFLYPEQVKDSFKNIDFKDQLQVNYFKEAHHLFVRLEDRNRLIKTIIQWLDNKF